MADTGQYIGDDAINHRLAAAEGLKDAIQAYRDQYGVIGLIESLTGYTRIAAQDAQDLAIGEVIARREKTDV